METNIGLVLEGGAMRGLFTVGVLDVLMENEIWIPTVVGVSAGAAFGCNYKSRQIGRALRYNLRFCRDRRYCSVRSLVRTGDLYEREFCYRTIPDELDIFDRKAFADNPMRFYVVCTDVLTGKPVYQRLDQVDDACMDWICASASMPMVSRPVTVGGYTLLDGGMSDSIPLRFLHEQGCDRNIVVLTQPREYVKPPASKALLRTALRRYPAMVRTMEQRHTMYRYERELVFNSEKAGNVLVICPAAPLSVGRVEHDPERLRETYEEGRREALNSLSRIKDFIGMQQ